MKPSTEEIRDEQLTAYLDGELTLDESKDLEQRLVHDESLRTRLAQLRRSYDLLDEIQETPYNQRFTQSTLELVIKDLKNTGTAAPSASSGPKPRWSIWLLICLGTIVVGSVVGGWTQYSSLRNELGDLAIAANLSGLADTYEVPVAIELAKETVAIELLRLQFAETLIPDVPKSLFDRAAWRQSLTPSQKDQLDQEREQLKSLNKSLQTRFEAMQDRIETEPNSESIQEALRLIGLVMNQIPNSERLYLERLSLENRIQYLREQMYRSAAMYYFSNRLSNEDSQQLHAWGDEVFLPAIKNLYQEFDRDRNDERFVNWTLTRFVRQADAGTKYPFQDDIIQELASRLSPAANDMLRKVGKRYELEVLAKCTFEDRLVSDSTLLDFYERIPERIRDSIDLASPSQIRRIMRDPRSSRRPL
jgi:hypothetical protein